MLKTDMENKRFTHNNIWNFASKQVLLSLAKIMNLDISKLLTHIDAKSLNDNLTKK